MTWTLFGHHMALLAWLQNWPSDGTSCISFIFGHQIGITILPPKFYLQDFATIWCLIHWLQFWPLALKANLVTSCKFGHQVQNLVIRWRHLHWFQCCPPGWVSCIATLPGIALLTLSVGIDLVSSSARGPGYLGPMKTVRFCCLLPETNFFWQSLKVFQIYFKY